LGRVEEEVGRLRDQVGGFEGAGGSEVGHFSRLVFSLVRSSESVGFLF
jgi:hypothetical protein